MRGEAERVLNRGCVRGKRPLGRPPHCEGGHLLPTEAKSTAGRRFKHEASTPSGGDAERLDSPSEAHRNQPMTSHSNSD